MILQKKGWDFKNAPMFSIKNKDDKEESREIDIVANHKSQLVKDAWNSLIIECKKQEKPWIFFKQNWKNQNYMSLSPNHIELTKASIFDWIDQNGIFKKHHYYNKKLATYYYVGLTNPDRGPSQTIYKAVTQVLDALIFYWKQLDKANDLIFFHPVIVFDGNIFEAIYKNEEFEIEESNHVCLLIDREFEEPEQIPFFNKVGVSKWAFTKPFIIEIVKFDYFEQYLDSVK